MSSSAEYGNRSIRSFVRRGGRITPSQQKALEDCWPDYGIDYSRGLLELPGGYAAACLEIGFGNGDALLSMAAADPARLYLGVEVHQPGIGRCLRQARQQGIANLRVIMHDAVEVMRDMIPPASLERVLLFFPDPWHKKRHHKRRIVNAAFRDLVHRALAAEGVFHAATDWQDYAEWIAAEFLGDARFVNLGDRHGYCPCPDYRPETRFERRGLRLGHGAWDLMFQKRK